MGWLEIIGQLLKLFGLVVGEIFEAKKAARLANEKWELTRARFAEIAEKCVVKMRGEAAEDHQSAIDVEDQVDADLKKP